MEYPALVFKCPGPHKHAKGTYDHMGVRDEDEHLSALADGWFASLPEAIIGPVETPVIDKAEEDSPPNRIELEAKATELNIPFDGRSSDAKLLAKITEALKA